MVVGCCRKLVLPPVLEDKVGATGEVSGGGLLLVPVVLSSGVAPGNPGWTWMSTQLGLLPKTLAVIPLIDLSNDGLYRRAARVFTVELVGKPM